MVRFKNRWLLITFAFDPYPSPPLSSLSADDLTASLPAPTPPPADLSAADVVKLIRTSLQANFGDLGSGIHGGQVRCQYYSPSLRIAIVRCARDSAKSVWAAVTLITECKGRRVRPRVIHIGGTVKKVQLKAIGLDKAAITNLQTIMDEPDSSSSDQGADTVPEAAPASTHIPGLDFGLATQILDEEEDAGSPVSLGELIPRHDG